MLQGYGLKSSWSISCLPFLPHLSDTTLRRQHPLVTLNSSWFSSRGVLILSVFTRAVPSPWDTPFPSPTPEMPSKELVSHLFQSPFPDALHPLPSPE